MGSLFPSPRVLPDPWIKSRSPALQADSFPSGPPGSIHNSECLPCFPFSLVCLEILPHPLRFCSSIIPCWSSQTLTLPLSEHSWWKSFKICSSCWPFYSSSFPMCLQFTRTHPANKQWALWVKNHLLLVFGTLTPHTAVGRYLPLINTWMKKEMTDWQAVLFVGFLMRFVSSGESSMVLQVLLKIWQVMWRCGFHCPGIISEIEGKARPKKIVGGVLLVVFFCCFGFLLRNHQLTLPSMARRHHC